MFTILYPTPSSSSRSLSLISSASNHRQMRFSHSFFLLLPSFLSHALLVTTTICSHRTCTFLTQDMPLSLFDLPFSKSFYFCGFSGSILLSFHHFTFSTRCPHFLLSKPRILLGAYRRKVEQAYCISTYCLRSRHNYLVTFV